jgi:UDP-N-acetylmuramate-alanine ligase
MPRLKKLDGTDVEVANLADAEHVQYGIAVFISQRTAAMQSQDLHVASQAANECNDALTIAEENERAIHALRLRDYVQQTLAASTTFIDQFKK